MHSAGQGITALPHHGGLISSFALHHNLARNQLLCVALVAKMNLISCLKAWLKTGASSQTPICILLLLLLFALQHCVSGDIRDLVKERWYKSLHADRLTPTTGVAEELLHKLKYLYKDSYS